MLTELEELWQENKIKLTIVGICIVLMGGYFIWSNFMDEKNAAIVGQSVSNTATMVNSQLTSSTRNGKIYVDVKGAVKKPGVYEVPANVRLNYVLARAGGVSDQADIDQVNLASQLTDQMIIYIPQIGEDPTINSPVLVKNQTSVSSEVTATTSVGEVGTKENADGAKINLNTATKEQLMELTGIGDKKADQIIAYRNEQGGFKSIEDLKNVSGIGEKTFATISSRLIV